MTTRFQQSTSRGFSAMELLLAVSIGAGVILAASVAYGTLTRNQPRAGNSAVVTLGVNTISNFYNLSQATISTAVAPSFGSLAEAEDMRERFLADTLSATAVYCLSRSGLNSFRPYSIAYNPQSDLVLENSLNFRQHLINKNLVTASVFTAKRNYDATSTNASIFVMGYSSDPTVLIVNAIYEIDVLRATSPSTGYYASVRRYTASASSAAALTQYYAVYYPPPQAPTSGLKVDTENFAPIWVSFERSNRADKVETTDIDRFKVAHEKPFYFIWWPDPAAKNLGMQFASDSAYAPTQAKQAYNHMGGRTSFMFTVPVFPAL